MTRPVQCFLVFVGAIAMVLANVSTYTWILQSCISNLFFSFEQGDKEFRLNKISNCGKDFDAEFNKPDHPAGHTNKIVLSGEMKVANDIVEPMELYIDTRKCYQTENRCIENFPRETIENLCEKFDDRNDSFWTPFFDGIVPRLGCPMKKVRSNHIGSNKNCVKLTQFLSIGNVFVQKCYHRFEYY
jgi:hypothetical protein